MKRSILRLFMIWLAAIPLLTTPLQAAKEGFGFSILGAGKVVAKLQRVNPPEVFLMGVKIAVRSSSIDSANRSVAERLARQLESELLSRDKRLTAEASRPETAIAVEVLANQASEEWETRRVTKSRQVGKDEKGKPIYQEYEEDVKYKIVRHNFSAGYKVEDLLTQATLAADSISIPFSGDFAEGKGAPQIFSLESQAIGRVVEQIARRLTPSNDVVNALLPKGSLETAADLATAGLWNRYLEALERQPPLNPVAEDSYRQYGMGVAYEALAYGAEDEGTTLKYLEKAASLYNQAIELKPKEKYFREDYDSALREARSPLQRVETALKNYRRLKDFKEQYAASRSERETSTQGAKNSERAPLASSQGTDNAGNIMDNAAVIRMIRAGLEEEIVLQAIDSAPQNSFDVSPRGLIELAEASVTKKIILKLQATANGKKAPTSGPTAKKRAAASQRPPGREKSP